MGKIFKALEKFGKTIEEEQKPVKEQDNQVLRHEVKTKTDQESVSKNNFLEKETIPKNIPHPYEKNLIGLDPFLVSALKPNSVEAEQFRNLKNNILFPEKGIPPRTIMVTSTAPGEGKSFVASNLAISIAQSIDEHVLLMDCDLRKPSIHTMFGFNDVYGLSEYLSLAKPIASLLLTTFLNKLKILPAGHIPDNPSELLSSEQMKNLLHEVKSRYEDRYIIVDTPPPYITSETSALSRQIDGIILVVRQGRSRKQDILDVIEIYGREKILGVVYNDAKALIGYGKYGYGK